jgi:hypothetical protein
MEEARLDNELERLHKKLPFLWRNFYLQERARLHALGQDSALEAAIASLHGDKNEQSRH